MRPYHCVVPLFQRDVHPGIAQVFLQVFICIGILVAYLAGLPYRNNTAQHVYIGGSDVAWWRVMLAFGLIPAALQVDCAASCMSCSTPGRVMLSGMPFIADQDTGLQRKYAPSRMTGCNAATGSGTILHAREPSVAGLEGKEGSSNV